MTIKECIDNVDNIKPNQYTIRDKVAWLSFIDEIIINDVLKTHEGYDGRYDDFTGYSEDKLSVALIVPSPYDRLYMAYLNMKIDEENGETARYNNSATLFNSYMMEYRKYYNKTHLPLRTPYKGKPNSKPTKLEVTEAQLEYLKRELYHTLSDDVNKAVSNDKLYDIVKNFISNNLEMIKENNSPANKISTVTLFADKWEGSESPYSQVVNISGIPIDYTGTVRLTPEQAEAFSGKNVAFIVGNKNGIITVYCIGQKLAGNYDVEIKFEKEERI